MIQEDLKTTISELLKIITVNTKGFTLPLFGTTGRYVVGLTDNEVDVHKIDNSLTEKLYLQACDVQKKFKSVNIGGWIDKSGKLYIDISTSTDNKRQAMDLARQYGQVAVYDLLLDEEVFV